MCVFKRSCKLFVFFAATQALSVLSVDMRAMDNKNAHNTSQYKNSSLIVRRNQEFIIVIRFDRPFNSQQDSVRMEFMIGEQIFQNISFTFNHWADAFIQTDLQETTIKTIKPTKEQQYLSAG